MTKKIHYADYLKLNTILNAQVPESSPAAHDETLFIIIHQAYELWFKQILHELLAVKSVFSKKTIPEIELSNTNHKLDRVVKILSLLVNQISIIETMTPQSFLEFRDVLVPASGFQSLQYRLLETHLGLTWKQRGVQEKKFFNSRLNPEELQTLTMALETKSLKELVDIWLSRLSEIEIGVKDFWVTFQGHLKDLNQKEKKMIKNNKTLSNEQRTYELQNLELSQNSFKALFDDKKYDKLLQQGQVSFSRKALLGALFITSYQQYPLMHVPFRLLQNLIEIDSLMTKWRQAHAQMAKRMLGKKIGTGGSSGHDYLKKAADSHNVFEDLVNLSSFILPNNKLPKLPSKLQKNLQF